MHSGNTPGTGDYYQSTTCNLTVVPEPATVAVVALIATLLLRPSSKPARRRTSRRRVGSPAFS